MPNIMDDFPSKYLKASDVEDHPTVTISRVTREEVGMDKEMKPILFVEEYDKGIVLNKTNANNISKLYGSESDDWPGKKVVLGTAWVDFQGSSVNSIRVWPPKRETGQKQPQAATKMGGVNAPVQRQVTQRSTTPVADELDRGQRPFAPPADDDGEIPFAPEFR